MKNRIQTSQSESSSLAFLRRQDLGGQVVAALVGAARRVFLTNRLRTIIVGVNPTTRVFAAELNATGKPLSHVDLRLEPKSEDEVAPFVMLIDEATSDEAVLNRAGAQSARCLVAATPDDDRNLSLCRTALETFRVPVVVARLKLMDGITSWAIVNDSGLSRLSWRDLIQTLVPNQVLSPVLSRLASADNREQIVEIEVKTPVHLGRKITDLPLRDCEVVGLTRRNTPVAEFEDVVLLMGDLLSIIGTKAGLERISESLTTL